MFLYEAYSTKYEKEHAVDSPAKVPVELHPQPTAGAGNDEDVLKEESSIPKAMLADIL